MSLSIFLWCMTVSFLVRGVAILTRGNEASDGLGAAACWVLAGWAQYLFWSAP